MSMGKKVYFRDKTMKKNIYISATEVGENNQFYYTSSNLKVFSEKKNSLRLAQDPTDERISSLFSCS
jgi:outer membrane protease